MQVPQTDETFAFATTKSLLAGLFRQGRLETVGTVMENNVVPLSFCAGAAIQGHPTAAIAMLANHVAECGECIPAGTLNLSGGSTEVVSVPVDET